MSASESDWRGGLTTDQIEAAECSDCHVRLLAGPGTGKTRTLTRHAIHLVADHGVPPASILVLTFTRVAAYQLRSRLEEALGGVGGSLPHVSTLHAFALRQLMRNSARVDALPKPLRIADDWEERHTVWEDLKETLGIRVREVGELFRQLSANWETLRWEEDPACEAEFPNPRFLGAWRTHRQVFGYSLRSELVYQLKQALNHYRDFLLEDAFTHVLVDEYQDLNPCDQAIIRELAGRGALIYAAGDDDQSIYGFRYANPEGIRRYTDTYPEAELKALEICHRCDRSILRLADFVASLDPRRIPKPTRPRRDAAEGEVRLFCFRDQHREARGIAAICRTLIERHGLRPEEILVLVRSDHQQRISRVLAEHMAAAGVPVTQLTEESPLDAEDGRRFLAFLRVLEAPDDHLSLRTILQLQPGIGRRSLGAVRDLCEQRRLRFAQALHLVRGQPDAIPRLGDRIAAGVQRIDDQLAGLRALSGDLRSTVEAVGDAIIPDPAVRDTILGHILSIVEGAGSETLGDLMRATTASMDSAEQELTAGTVNILTMHKAKGIEADAVIIAGAEDQMIPGRNRGNREGDERRLLYVSMTRARHHLFMTYCSRRTRDQRYIGSETGNPRRDLTVFLRDAPITVEHV